MARSIPLALLAAVVGCGGHGRPNFPPPVVPAAKVKFSDGTPLSHVQLYFVPTQGIAPAFGKVADNGTFTLTTYEGKEGICPGKYVVYVRANPAATPTEASKGTTTLRKVPEKFKDDSSKSPLEVEVTPGTAALDLVVALR